MHTAETGQVNLGNPGLLPYCTIPPSEIEPLTWTCCDVSKTASADTMRSVRGGGYTPEGQSEEEETHTHRLD